MNNRDEHIREKREVFLNLAESHASRALHDQRWDRLRTPINRKRLVVATYAMLLVYSVANFSDQPFLALFALIGFMGLAWMMRIASRTIPDIPDELVDERMRAVRGVVYRYAYIGAVTIFSFVIALEIGLTLLGKVWPSVGPLTGEQWFELMFIAFFATLVLPSAIFLWTEPEL
ncbi:MAG: hypothetical protein AAGH76_13745 [Pseudomonadota bacterium]